MPWQCGQALEAALPEAVEDPTAPEDCDDGHDGMTPWRKSLEPTVRLMDLFAIKANAANPEWRDRDS